MPVHACRLDQAHDCGRTLTGPQASSKQPVAAPKGNGPDLVLNPVVIHGQLPIVHKPGECQPHWQVADALGAPLTYLYCEDDKIAALLLALHQLEPNARERKVEEFLGQLNVA